MVIYNAYCILWKTKLYGVKDPPPPLPHPPQFWLAKFWKKKKIPSILEAEVLFKFKRLFQNNSIFDTVKYGMSKYHVYSFFQQMINCTPNLLARFLICIYCLWKILSTGMKYNYDILVANIIIITIIAKC